MKLYANRSNIAGALMGASAVFFFQDVATDLFEHWQNKMPYSTRDLIHLVFEAFAVISLTIGIVEVLAKVKDLKRDTDDKTTKLKHLREDFDDLVKTKFVQWDLSAAESDVALLIIRGLSVDEIAEMRNVAKGTVKVQSHKLMHKAGVRTRVELMSLFLDEFIEQGQSAPILP